MYYYVLGMSWKCTAECLHYDNHIYLSDILTIENDSLLKKNEI